MSEITTGFTGPKEHSGAPAMHAPQGQIELERQNIYREAWTDLASRGWESASVVNLHPFKLYTTGVLLKELSIPGVPRDKALWELAPKLKLPSGASIPYFQHIFDQPDINVAPRVSGSEISPEVILGVHTTLPWQFAADVMQQNNQPKTRGGVFCYAGEHAPLSNPKTREVEMARIEKAHADQIMFYNSLLDEANSAHAEGNRLLIREIGKYHRWAVMYLRMLGQLHEDPKWFNRDVTVGAAKVKTCVSCGHEEKTEALRCTNGSCTYIFEPFEAFDKFVIGLDTPGATLALRRLTHDQIKLLIKSGKFQQEELDKMGFVNKKAN